MKSDNNPENYPNNMEESKERHQFYSKYQDEIIGCQDDKECLTSVRDRIIAEQYQAIQKARIERPFNSFRSMIMMIFILFVLICATYIIYLIIVFIVSISGQANAYYDNLFHSTI